MKAILLAGGLGSRLYPVTLGVSKQLIPVYDKPMIYYPLSVLLMSGIRDILIISTPMDISAYKRLLGEGSKFGVNLNYKVQEHPNGIAEAFIVGEEFIGKDPVCLILGDNIFYGLNFSKKLESVIERTVQGKIGTIFGFIVKNPERYGVIEMNNKGNILSIKEKPKKPKTNYAVAGLYFYPNEVIEIAKKIPQSARGEFEITDINNYFLRIGKLEVEILGQGFTWLDTGTHESLLEAGQFVQTVEKREGIKIGCLEEIAYKMKFISKNNLLIQAQKIKGSPYGEYILKKYS